MDYWLRYAGSEENVLFRRPKNSCVVIEELLLSSKKKIFCFDRKELLFK